MKQLILVGALTLIGTVGTFAIAPFCSVAIYYIFAVLRPQFIWEWSLPPGVAWSRYVALSAIFAAFLVKIGVFPGNLPPDDGRNRGGKGHSQALCAVYFGWLLVTYFMARDRTTSEPYVVEYLKIFAMLAASTILIRTIRQLWILLVAATVCLGYISYEVNSAYFSTGMIVIAKNGYGGLDNNGAGLMLAMGLPLCLAIWDGLQSRWRWGFLAMVPVIAHSVMMTYSRGAMLSLIVVSPLMLIRSRRWLQLLGFGLLFVVLALPTLAGPEIRKRFFSINEVEKDESAQSRFGSWTAAWKMACDNPVFGVGVRNANLFSFQYGADMEGRTIHSQYLQIAADNGFVGLGLYLALLASVFADLRRVRRATRKRDDPESRRTYAIASGTETSLATFCFGGLFLSLETFELPYLLLLLAWKVAEIVSLQKIQPVRPAGTRQP
jgi:probable O-glycosylation ligase (exosortase A-associated)